MISKKRVGLEKESIEYINVFAEFKRVLNKDIRLVEDDVDILRRSSSSVYDVMYNCLEDINGTDVIRFGIISILVENADVTSGCSSIW